MKIKKQHLFIVSFIGLIVVLTIYPFFQDGLTGYVPDLKYHLSRIEGVKAQLITGDFPGRIYSIFFNGYGYGSPMFYPDIFLIIPAILRILGIAPLLTYKIFAGLLVLGVAVSTYFSFKYITKKRYTALCSTLLLCLSQFYLTDLHARVGIGEYMAFIFMPIAIAGLYDFLVMDFKKPWILGLGFGGMLLCHSIMFALCVVIFVCIGIFHIRTILKAPGNLLKLILTAGITMALTAFYWLPMIEQIISIPLNFSTPWAMVGDYTQSFNLFFVHEGRFNYIAYIGIGVPLLVFLMLRFFIKKPKHNWINKCLLIGSLIFLATLDILPWNLLEKTPLNAIQFTYRLYPYGLAFLSLGCGMVIDAYGKTFKERQNLLFALTGMCMIFAMIQCNTFALREESLTIDETLTNGNYSFSDTGMGEWLMVGTDISQCQTPDTVVASDASTLKAVKEGTKLQFESDGTQAYYDVPLLFYKGYSGVLVTTDGERHVLPVSISPKNNLVRVKNPSGLLGQVTVDYTGTRWQKVADGLTLISWIIAALYLIGKRRGWFNEKKLFTVKK